MICCWSVEGNRLQMSCGWVGIEPRIDRLMRRAHLKPARLIWCGEKHEALRDLWQWWEFAEPSYLGNGQRRVRENLVAW
jgi:hypothetical protein